MLRIIKLVDVPAGSNEAKITRQLNGETITVTWDITRPLSEGLDDDEDAFGDDDDEDDEDAVAAKKSAKKMDSHEDEEAEDEDEDEMEEPLALTVDITKPDMGTLSFFCEYSGDMQSISIRYD